MENLNIVKVIPNDIDRLQQIARLTFHQAFSEANSEENMRKYLEESFSSEKLIFEHSNPDTDFYFATEMNDVVGYMKVNFGDAQTELKDHSSLEIERIYVLKEYHGKKVGQLLYEKAMEIAKRKNLDYLWLGVWEENKRAISFYQKNGFVEFDKHTFWLGDEEQTDLMMKLQLRKD